MTAREWNKNQEKNTRLQDLGAAVSEKMFLAFVVLALCIFYQQGVRGQARRIQLADFGKAVSVSDPQISPDGKSIVYVLSRANMEQDRNDRDLVLHEIATAARRPHARIWSKTAMIAIWFCTRSPLLPGAP